MAVTFLSIGSNLGEREENLQRVFFLLSLSLAKVTKSHIYETEPWRAPNHPWYLNACVRGETEVSPEEVLDLCKKIERELGRDFSTPLSPRPIDVDILFYDDRIVESKTLVIPHSRLHLRCFVLQPLSEIAPSFVHPIFKKTVRRLLHECPDKSEVRLYKH